MNRLYLIFTQYLEFVRIFEGHDRFVSRGVQNIAIGQHFVNVLENVPIVGSAQGPMAIRFVHFSISRIRTHITHTTNTG